MKENKILNIVIITLNIIGLICLIYFMIPYLTHDMSMGSPNSMLSGYTWDTGGFILTIGLIPLIIANVLAFKFININKYLRLLFFIPSIICLIIVGHYLIVATEWKEEVINPETTFRCVLGDKVYKYEVYYDGNEYSLGMDVKDELPISIIDYTSIDSIEKSIEDYYKNIGGQCP